MRQDSGFVRRLRTLEVRWIRSGSISDEMLRWFDADGFEERADRYLLGTSANVGVKIRGGVQLEVKTLERRSGHVGVPGGGSGLLETWEKWSFPLDVRAHPPAGSRSWRTVTKLRRRRSFTMAHGMVVERPLRDEAVSGCTVELTQVVVDGQRWWTVGLEAAGEGSKQRADAMRATLDAVFPWPIPGSMLLDVNHSTSYARWLDGTGNFPAP